MAPGKGWLDWLLSKERRHGRPRKALPLVAYYWDGALPIAHRVRDVSASGLYLLTEHRWYPGTVLAMTLQWTEAQVGDPDRSVTVNARVVRSTEDGVGFEFVLPEKGSPFWPLGLPADGTDAKKLNHFLQQVSATVKTDTTE